MLRLHALPSGSARSQPACIVMVDLVGSTRLAHELPLPHYAALMTEFIQLLMLSFETWDGTVLQHQGDALIGYWKQTDTTKAVQAALEIPERLSQLSLARSLGIHLQVRAGVARGEVTLSQIGLQPTAYGLPVNLARRLCDAAQPGEVFVSERVQRACAEALAPLEFQLCLEFPRFEGFDPSWLAFRVTSRQALVAKVDHKGRMKVV